MAGTVEIEHATKFGRHISGWCQSDRRRDVVDENADVMCHEGGPRRIALPHTLAFDQLESFSEREWTPLPQTTPPTGCRRPTLAGNNLQRLQDRQNAQASPPATRTTNAERRDRDEHTALSCIGATGNILDPERDDKKLAVTRCHHEVTDEVTKQEEDIRNERHLKTTRRHFDHPQTTASSHDGDYYLSKNHRHHPHHNQRQHHDGARYQSHPSRNLTHTSTRQKSQSALGLNTATSLRSILVVIFANAILNHLTHLSDLGTTIDGPRHLQLFAYPSIVGADTVNECFSERDCGHPDRTCYENKCICKRAKPIEDKTSSECLPHASLNEACFVNEQCIGSSICTDGACACPIDHISIFNPSTRLHYCHPKRRLREECNYDAQCPENAFCSIKKHGCLCQNGYGPSLVRANSGVEYYDCLPKLCQKTSDCESKYHFCEDNKCKCLATHFDPHTAECYKFAATGGQLGGSPTINGNTTMLDVDDTSGIGFINDLMRNGDKLWLIVIILAVLTLIILAILIIVLRKYYLGYCWTHTKEYEPNNDSSQKNGQFSKNSINNKSFRKKNGEDLEELGGVSYETAADKSSLVTATTGKKKKSGSLLDAEFADRSDNSVNENHYVQVDMRGTGNEESAADENRRSPPGPSLQYQRSHHLTRPLPSSTSTPV